MDVWEMLSMSLRLNHAELRGWSRLNIIVNTILADTTRCGCISEWISMWKHMISFFSSPPSLCVACSAEMGTRDEALQVRQFQFKRSSWEKNPNCLRACKVLCFLGNIVLFTRSPWTDSSEHKWGVHTIACTLRALEGSLPANLQFCRMLQLLLLCCFSHTAICVLLETFFAGADGTAMFS